MRHCMGSGLTYIPFTCYFIFSPLEKGFMVHMKKNKHLHLPSLVEIGPVVLVEKTKTWKVYGQADNRWSEKLIWPFTSDRGFKEKKTYEQSNIDLNSFIFWVNKLLTICLQPKVARSNAQTQAATARWCRSSVIVRKYWVRFSFL